MSVTQITPVASKPPAEARSVPDSARRDVSATEADDFATTVQSAPPAKPDYSNYTMKDLNEELFKGIVNNMLSETARMREELKQVMEDQS